MQTKSRSQRWDRLFDLKKVELLNEQHFLLQAATADFQTIEVNPGGQIASIEGYRMLPGLIDSGGYAGYAFSR